MIMMIIIISMMIISSSLAATLVNNAEISLGLAKPPWEITLVCHSSQIYNSASTSCETCSSTYGVNSVPDTSVSDGIGNYLRCTCAAGYYKSVVTTGLSGDGSWSNFVCTSCYTQCSAGGSNASICSSTEARTGCTTCSTGTTENGVYTGDTECSCATNTGMDKFMVETSSGKVCNTCPTGSLVVASDTVISGKKYKGSLYKCQSCPDPYPYMTMSYSSGTYSCACDAAYTKVGYSTIGEETCVLTSLASTFTGKASTAYVVSYGSVSVQSITFQHYFIKAAAHCKFYGGPADIQQCQILANLCVLQMYDDTSDACAAFIAAVEARTSTVINSINNFVKGMPWLYIAGRATAADTCTQMTYTGRVSLSAHVMYYVLSTYTMNGTFVGYQRLETVFQYCGEKSPRTNKGGGTSSSTGWQYFGASEITQYSCNVTTLETKAQYFYELFLYDPKTEKYHPVPVRIKNLKSNNVLPNDEDPEFLCDNGNVLVRRFFLYDVVSSLSSSSSRPLYVRYASQIRLDVSLTSMQSTRIFPPVLSLQYKYHSTSDGGALATSPNMVTYYFKAFYRMPMAFFTTTLKNFFIVICVFMGLLFALRWMNWYARHTRPLSGRLTASDIGGLNIKSLVHFCMLSMHTGVIFFFPILTLICWYFFVFFKLQKTPSIFLPPMESLYSKGTSYFYFTCCLHILAVFQVAYVAFIVFQQCKMDIFFIDWEPAKSKSDGGTGNVSAWRTILAINEWSAMQTMRKIDINFTLFWVLFFLLGVGLEKNATNQPNLSSTENGQLNVVLRYANTTFWWLLLGGTQFCWRYFIYDRYLSEPQEQIFVDFCTIAKVSLLVMDEKFHGYYLHCRSPHQFADGSMAELMEMIHKEEAGLTVDRSLDGAPSDVQSFQIFVTGEWRACFDKIYSNLANAPSISDIIRNGKHGNRRGAQRGMSKGQEALQLPQEKELKSWREIAIFIQEFVENNFGKGSLRRAYKEPTYLEQLLGTCPDLSSPESPNVFFPDRNFDYKKVLFLGHELNFLLMHILSYSLFDLWFGSTAISALLTWLLDYLFCFIRGAYGKAIVAKKTLVDERFIITSSY